MSGISVVVPTRDRPAALGRCLEALRGQRGVADLEVVVVDDGSRDAEAVAALVSGEPGRRLVRLDGKGPAAARNAGARAARGETLLLTDDDCVPDGEWVARLSRRLEAGDVDVVSGLTLPGSDDACLVASQTISSYAAAHVPLLLGNNLCCRRSLLLEQPFSEAFAEAAGEDREWSERLRSNGVRVSVEPGAIVWHNAELDLGSFWRQHLRYGRAAGSPGGSRARPPLQPWRFYAGLVRTGFGRGPRVGLLVCLSQLATGAGRLSARRRRRAARLSG